MNHNRIAQFTEFLKQESYGGYFSQDVDQKSAQEKIDYICHHLKESGIVDINSATEYRIFNLISFCSVVGSCLVFLTGIWNPKLSQHPYKLVSMIALIDATYFLLFNTLDEVCDLKLQTIYAYTAYFDGSPES